jgi:RsiW-degrading membrane proteinase PrsW (M82 family)
MTDERDPVQRAAGDDTDLYDVATWEPRTGLDRAAAWLHGALVTGGRASVVALAVLIVAAQFAAAAGLVFVDRPVVAVYVLLSVVPAFGLAAYIWKVDVTMEEPLELLVVTFGLGFLFAGFAAVVNSQVSALFFADRTAMTVVGSTLFYFLVVGPVEETVKWLAVRLYAFRSSQFDAVVDGAVYGAMAGLGFATIENAIYIVREVLTAAQAPGGEQAVAAVAFQTAAVRTFAGPGHVIYSAFAGYYLGLAKFNPDDAGPIVVKGLTIAALIHATYNTAVTNLGAITDPLGLPAGVSFLAFVVLYDGVFFYALYRKLDAYRDAYVATGAQTTDEGDAAGAGEDKTAGYSDADAEVSESTETAEES